MNKEENFAGRTIDGRYVIANTRLPSPNGDNQRLFYFYDEKNWGYGIAKVFICQDSIKWHDLFRGLFKKDAKLVYDRARQNPEILAELIASLEIEGEDFSRSVEVRNGNESPLEKLIRIVALSDNPSEVKKADKHLDKFFLRLYTQKGKNGEKSMLMGSSNEPFKKYKNEIIDYLVEGHKATQYEREESLRSLRNIQSKFNTFPWRRLKYEEDGKRDFHSQVV